MDFQASPKEGAKTNKAIAVRLRCMYSIPLDLLTIVEVSNTITNKSPQKGKNRRDAG